MRKVIEKIQNAHSVAIIPHINEDADALGSCFAFASIMRRMGKEAVVYVSEVPEKRIEFIGEDYVIYNPEEVYSHDLCACIDCGDLKRIGDRVKLFNECENTINIDHHFTNTNFAQANYVDAKAAAAGEILCMLFKEMCVEITNDEAASLFGAICSDTGSFKYSNVTPRTMRIAAELLEHDFDHADIARRLFDCESEKSALMRAEVTQAIHSYLGGLIRVVTVGDDIYEKYDIAVKDAPNFVDIPRCIDGTEVAVCIKPQNGQIRVNLRSNNYFDVSETAVKFGGGGHVRAAGCNIDAKNLCEAEKMIVSALEKDFKKY